MYPECAFTPLNKTGELIIHAEQIQVTLLGSADGRLKAHVVPFHTIRHNPSLPCGAALDSQQLVVLHWTIPSEEYRVSVLQVLTVFFSLAEEVYLYQLATARGPVAI